MANKKKIIREKGDDKITIEFLKDGTFLIGVECRIHIHWATYNETSIKLLEEALAELRKENDKRV